MIYFVKSPAKINIGLRVLSKRSDGYHNIETIFYPLKVYDDIKIKIEKLVDAKRNIISVKTSSNQDLNDKKNICHKAAEIFFDTYKANGKYKINISIKKNIPMGAGLGGGSSNAATILKVLAKHFKENNTTLLYRIALKLGSDVPFFLLCRSAYATGRGEILEPLKNFKIKYKILLVNPNIHVSTSRAYEQLRVSGSKLQILNNIKIFNPNDKRLMINDFEMAVFKKYPVIEKIKYEMFKQGAIYALMSGSGSTVFGLFTYKKIKAAKKYFSSFGYVFVS